MLRRSPLRARTALRRKARLRTRHPMRRRSPRRAPTSPADLARLSWLHRCPCAAPGAPSGCRGRPTVHHDTQDRALGRKAPHDRGIPMCWGHGVVAFHDGTGPFKGWTKARRRAWQSDQVAKYRALYAAHLAAEQP